MRVVLVGPVYPYRGGIAHYTTMLHRALQGRGHEVLLVSFKRQYPQWLFPGRSDRDPSKKPLRVEDAQYWIDSLNLFTWLATFWRIRRYQPDAVIMQWWTTFWAPVWLVLGLLNRLFLHRPLVYICHNVLPHEARFWDPWLAKLALWWGTRFIVQSMEEKKQLVAFIPQANTVVAPIPVYDVFADERIPKAEARKLLGLSMNVPVLLFFGIVREYKGLEDLLAALPAVQAQLEAVILLVAGEFWEDGQGYLEMIERLGIGESVIVEDRYIPNERVPIYFSAADILVAPYRRVTGSAAVQMALAFECPVITTNTGSLAELASYREDVLVVPPSDPSSLANAIVHYFANAHTIRVSLSTHNEKRASSWSSLVDAIESSVVQVGASPSS